MKTKETQIEVRMQRLFDFFSEDLLSVSEEELDKAIRASGQNPKEVERAGRMAIAEVLGEFNLEALSKARDQHGREVERITKKNSPFRRHLKRSWHSRKSV